MAEYRLSADADTDVASIYRYSYETFGARQADIYADGMKRAMERLAEMPEIGRKADDLRAGLFRYRYQSHMIFYTIEPARIVIRRILHARMDFESWL